MNLIDYWLFPRENIKKKGDGRKPGKDRGYYFKQGWFFVVTFYAYSLQLYTSVWIGTVVYIKYSFKTFLIGK